jgi:hypothetical protein
MSATPAVVLNLELGPFAIERLRRSVPRLLCNVPEPADSEVPSVVPPP